MNHPTSRGMWIVSINTHELQRSVNEMEMGRMIGYIIWVIGSTLCLCRINMALRKWLRHSCASARYLATRIVVAASSSVIDCNYFSVESFVIFMRMSICSLCSSNWKQSLIGIMKWLNWNSQNGLFTFSNKLWFEYLHVYSFEIV